MRVWLTSFVVLFGAAELYQWVQAMTLPMPIFVLGGAFLAIASNYDKLRDLPFHVDYQEPTPKEVEASQPQSVQPSKRVKLSDRPVSFEIHKPFKPGD